MTCNSALSSLMPTPSPHCKERAVKEAVRSSRKYWLPRKEALRGSSLVSTI